MCRNRFRQRIGDLFFGRLVTEHGYGITPGSKLLILANPQESEVIQSFKAGVTNNNTQISKYDFIPSAAAPPYMTDKHVVGEVAPDIFAGLEVAGQYGRGLLIEHNLIPAGYFAVVATGGPGSASNVIGFREHDDPAWRGLRIIPGYRTHPIIDSYYQRSFGVGTRHRAGACVFQIKASGSYEIPTIAI
ncbi:hypothetical protein O6072_02640 [Mycolicibacterium neoaurum]|uniref:hypothetical protein n=1 Tax=Mycolicibacterium neoaurum TaxID=1795 RepID=UPI00248B6702|nr:hypothetical protein [Mycolicibacterium neoaurum]WBP94904.1 hypothetical protein O7W24_01475 [Mycolicibacterium neoaurum]WBS08797.1 hypothetical protein O6072_02640 [Mycolicibacterium neoaurum]